MFEPQSIASLPRPEWGPAHLRDDAVVFDVEPVGRPDDN